VRTFLVEASPRDPATGAIVETRLAGGGSKPYLWLGFSDWRAGVMDMPRFTTELDFGEAGWTGGAIPQTAALNFMSADSALVSELAQLYWKDAPLTIKVGDDSADAPTFPLLLTAIVASVEIAEGLLTLTIGDLGAKLNKPLVTGTFAGTGGLEGAESAKGRVKRRTFGYAFNIVGEILDPAYLIYEFGDPLRPLAQFNRVRDRGREGPLTVVGWQGSAEATLAALKASVPQQGGGVAAPSIACVKWWTTASGPLTADIGGEQYPAVATAPSVAALLASEAGLTISNREVVNAIRPQTVGLHCPDASETIAGAIDRLLIGSSLLWVLDPNGTIRLEQWSLDSSLYSVIWTGTATAPVTWAPSGSSPVEWQQVETDVEEVYSESVARRVIYAPIKARKLGYQANNRVMNDGEVSAAILASDTFYPDGTRASDLQPAQAGADVTGDNTAKDTAAIGGIPTAQFLERFVGLETILAPTGEIKLAIQGIRDDLGDVEERTDTVEAQIAGTSESYLKTQIVAAAGIGSAAAESVSTLRSDVFGDGGLAATVTVQQGTLNTLTGRTLAYYQIEADAGPAGTDAFVTLRAETQPGQPVTSSVAVGARVFMVYNPANGGWLKTLEVSGGNVRIYGNLAVDGSVTTNNIQQNNVTKSVRWAESYNGTSLASLVASSSSYGTFGAGNPAQVTVNVLNAGAEVTLNWFINLQRTGDDNDRVSFRLRRTDQNGGIAYIGDLLRAGMGNYPVTVNWAWDDTGLPVGQYTYAIEGRRDQGGGTVYNAKLIAEIGYR